MKPCVAVAVAVSSCEIIVCKAISGGWKRRPAPRPAIIWNPMISPRDDVAFRWMYSPFPTAHRITPIQMSSRYLPVEWMTDPAVTPIRASVTISGRMRRPERMGDASLTD